MKSLLITESERNRILGMHKSATSKHYLMEQTTGSSLTYTSTGTTSESGTPPAGCPSFDSPWYKNVYDMGFTATVGYQWEPALSKKMGSSKEAICSCFKANPNYGENSDEYYDMCA
jgi:hypothetical protein